MNRIRACTGGRSAWSSEHPTRLSACGAIHHTRHVSAHCTGRHPAHLMAVYYHTSIGTACQGRVCTVVTAHRRKTTQHMQAQCTKKAENRAEHKRALQHTSQTARSTSSRSFGKGLNKNVPNREPPSHTLNPTTCEPTHSDMLPVWRS